MTFSSPNQPVAKKTTWPSLALLAGCFVLSCGVVVGVVVIEFTHYSRSNTGMVEESFLLLDGSLLLGLLAVLGLLAARR